MGLLDLVGDVVSGACDLASDVTDVAFNTVETVFDAGSDLVDIAHESARDLLDIGTNASSSALETLFDGADSLVEEIKEMPLDKLAILAGLAVAKTSLKSSPFDPPTTVPLPRPIEINALTSSLMARIDAAKVKPKRGSIVFAKIIPAFEHSGVYVGENKIVELTGEGEIRKTNSVGFTSGLVYGDIYVACQGNQPIHLESIAQKAESYVGSSKNYNLATENCHLFTAGCITGDFQNVNVLFTFLNLLLIKEFGKFEWRRCQLD